MSNTRKNCQYRFDANIKVPKTTRWRKEKAALVIENSNDNINTRINNLHETKNEEQTNIEHYTDNDNESYDLFNNFVNIDNENDNNDNDDTNEIDNDENMQDIWLYIKIAITLIASNEIARL